MGAGWSTAAEIATGGKSRNTIQIISALTSVGIKIRDGVARCTAHIFTTSRKGGRLRLAPFGSSRGTEDLL